MSGSAATAALAAFARLPPELAENRILVVDDEPTTVESIQAHLAAAGFRAVSVTTEPAEMIDLMRSVRPDIVVLDLIMPRVSGFDLLAAVASDSTLAKIPVLVLTSAVDVASRLRSLTLGAADFVSKPVEPAELVLRLRNHLMVRRYERELWREQDRSNRLLARMLPPAIAERLKNGEPLIADRFPDVTVLVAGLANFSVFAAQADPQSLVVLLNYTFGLFDQIVRSRGLEKIKTSGDSYLLAGGVPEAREDHMPTVVEAGLEMLRSVEHLESDEGSRLELRIGVQRGPVVAGVIGAHRTSYDVWGQTVDTATRILASAPAGALAVSGSVAAQLGSRFALRPGPEATDGGGGATPTYLVSAG